MTEQNDIPVDPQEMASETYLMMRELRTTVIGTPGTDDKGICGAVRAMMAAHEDLVKIVMLHIQGAPQGCQSQLQYCDDKRTRLHTRIDDVHTRVNKLSKWVWILVGASNLAAGGIGAFINHLATTPTP